MAKEFYGYFDSLVEDEREYDAAQFAHILRAGMVSGVTSHAGGGLQVTAPETGMTTQVSPGGCVVNGYLFVLEDDGGGVRSFSHQPSAASDRWDRIVARLDTSAAQRKITLEVRAGTPGADPEPPALERDGNVYELALAKVKIRAGAESIETADVVDERANAQVCGYAVPVWLRGLTGFDPDEMEAEVGRKAVTAFYTATLTAAGWTGSAAPYVQEAAVEGLLSSDSPIVAVSMENATTANYEAITESWANVSTIDAGDGKITAKCFGEKPAADLTLLIKVVR